MTDVQSVAFLEPKADGFRNYYGKGAILSPTAALVDRAALLTSPCRRRRWSAACVRSTPTPPVPSTASSPTSPGTLTNDFFVNLLDMSTKWEKSAQDEGLLRRRGPRDRQAQVTATPVDLAFGSVRSCAPSPSRTLLRRRGQVFQDFVKAWTKVMSLDRFDLKCHHRRALRPEARTVRAETPHRYEGAARLPFLIASWVFVYFG
ncbi:MAG: hypothetical protein R2748_26780 [Bryobacterales bacterium]